MIGVRPYLICDERLPKRRGIPITMSNQRTPLYSWHFDHKARLVPFGGWDMPVQYTSIIDEHQAVRTGVGLFDISHMARINFVGPDALQLLESTFTNAVSTMKMGQVKYGLICNEAGGILDDILVYNLPTGYAAVVNASNRHKIIAHWKTHATKLNLNVKIQDATESTALIALQGPHAVGLIRELVNDDVATLKYYYATPANYHGSGCVVSRTGYTGEDGFEVSIANDLAICLWEELIAQGATPCGLGARDTLRLEAGMPLYGHELNETINPLQAGLGWAVKLDHGDFIGRDALQNSTKTTVRVGLELEGKRAAREGCPILFDGLPHGTVTSGSYAPTLEKSIAMGYVTASLASVGTELQVDIRGTLTPAKVVELPFYKRKK